MNQKNPHRLPLPTSKFRDLTADHTESLEALWPDLWLFYAAASQISLLAAKARQRSEERWDEPFP